MTDITGSNLVRLCEGYGIEFECGPVRGWAWRSIGDDVTRFAWIGSFLTVSDAAAYCSAYCGFDD